jgi:hypothetical protein
MKPVLSAIVALIVIAVVGAGAFIAGSNYGEAQAQNTRAEFFRNRQGGAPNGQGAPTGQNGQNGQGGQFGRPAAFGTVKSVSGNTIQVTQQDGSTVTVTTDAQTTIQKTVSGALSDIQPGERITVMSGQTGSTIVARDIQIRPGGQQQ